MISPKARVLTLSVLAGVVTLGLKFAAYYLTGSVGLLSDAAESLVNITAAVVALVALQIASRPADVTHTYGHDKAEYFSSGSEGTLILIAAVAIVFAAVRRFLDPAPLHHLDLGLAVALVAAGINFFVARAILSAARRYESITLEADARHLFTDVWTSAGVVTGLIAVAITGWTMLDPLIALGVATHITISGVDLIRRSFHGLMDYALPVPDVELIHGVMAKHKDRYFSYHALRTRQSASQRFIDLHLLVPGRTSVRQSHDLCKLLESEIEAVLSNTHVTIHVEPTEDVASWDDPQLPGASPGR